MTQFKALLMVALLLVSTGCPAFATYFPESFGGDGSDGTTTISSNTGETTAFNRNHINYTVNSSIVHTVKSGSIIKTTGAVTINGTISVSADIPGGGAATAGGLANVSAGAPGSGPSPGSGGLEANAVGSAAGSNGGGGGGGCGGAGSQGEGSSFQAAGMGGGAVQPNRGLTGSGGGSAYRGPGGKGGGSVNIFSNGTITIASGGLIEANGTAGTNGTISGGGGGGSGGVIGIYSQTATVVNGTLRAKGALGAAGPTLYGGDGGGGWIIRMSPSNTGSGSLDVAAVDAGAPGQTLTITGMPTHPTLTSHSRNSDVMMGIARAQAAMTGAREIRVSGRSNATLMAAMESSDFQSFASRLTSLLHGSDENGAGVSCEAVGDSIKAGGV